MGSRTQLHPQENPKQTMIIEENKFNNTLNSLKRQIEEIIKNRLRTSEIIDKSYIT